MTWTHGSLAWNQETFRLLVPKLVIGSGADSGCLSHRPISPARYSLVAMAEFLKFSALGMTQEGDSAKAGDRKLAGIPSATTPLNAANRMARERW